LEYTQCNTNRCKLAPGRRTIACNKKHDVVLLIDGSGSLGRKGWRAEKKAAQMFVDAFNGGARRSLPKRANITPMLAAWLKTLPQKDSAFLRDHIAKRREWRMLSKRQKMQRRRARRIQWRKASRKERAGIKKARRSIRTRLRSLRKTFRQFRKSERARRRSARGERKKAMKEASARLPARMAVILYSGPRTWSGVRKCTGKNPASVNLKRTCKIRTITHFTSNMRLVKRKIRRLRWPRGSTLTSLALLTAKAELNLGRKEAKSNVIVFTDGRPLSYRATGLASDSVRKVARLVWVPVTKNAPLKYIKAWATRRWQENVVVVNTFKELEKPDVVTHIIANICPKTNPEAEFTRG